MKKIFWTIICIMTFVIYSQNSAFSNTYKDINTSHWAYNEIKELSKSGIVTGYPDGTFRPNDYVTRAEFTTMVIRGLHQQNAEITDKVTFRDVPRSHWAYSNIQRAIKFELIKGTPEGCFYPNELVTRAHMVSMTINSLLTRTISEKRAREILQNTYSDYVFIPDWLIITAAKAEVLDMNVKVPHHEKMYNADHPATRAEATVAVYKMMQEAKINPNKQLAAAMRPPKGKGAVIKTAKYEGTVITLPVGTRLPIVLIDGASSQINKTGDLFMAKAPVNYITQDNYIIIFKNSAFAGKFLDVKKGKYFAHNGKLDMQVEVIKTANLGQEARFYGVVDTVLEHTPWYTFSHAIFRGAKVNINNTQTIDLELTKEVKIDATNGEIIVPQ